MNLNMVLAILLSMSTISANFCNACTSGQEKPDRFIFKVEGSALAEAPADLATFSFAIRGIGNDLESAVNSAKSTVEAIAAELFKLGLSKEDFHTSHFTSGSNYQDKAFFTSKRDYAATIHVLVEISDLSLIGQAIIAVSKHKPEKLSDVSFTLKEFATVKAAAFERAIQKAKEKASIAQKNLDIGEMRTIYFEEITDAPTSNSVAALWTDNDIVHYGDDPVEGSAGGFFPETVTIRSRVRVHFEILP